MTQSDLNRAVSRATGETAEEIAHRGFGVLQSLPHEPTAEALISRWRYAHRWRRRGGRRNPAAFAPRPLCRAA